MMVPGSARSMNAALRLVALLLAFLLPWQGAAQAALGALGPLHHHAPSLADIERLCCAPDPHPHHHEHAERHHHAADDGSELDAHEHADEEQDAPASGAGAQPALPVRAVPPLAAGRDLPLPDLRPGWCSVIAPPLLPPPRADRA